MAKYFWEFQSDENRKNYIELLSIMGSLSNLFSDSQSPYLYYRAHEYLFCEVFEAKNLSRGDVSFDATKNGIGIGLKTFLNGNGQTFQKVAEFNSDSDSLRSLKNAEDVVYHVSDLRNKRILFTQNSSGTKDNIYHLVTREPSKMNIIETPMELIDINSIKINKKQNKNTIRFKDKFNDYSFSLSKNTLLKRFDTSRQKIITQFSIEMLANPFHILKQIVPVSVESIIKENDENNFIILPLYSPRTNKVEVKSGLNQWNAKGRVRHHDEIYIPIPSWIHRKFNDFFIYSRDYIGESAKDSPNFEVELPNGNIINCKVAQQGGKALMSNPNRDLGKWLLRDVLNIQPHTLVTIDMLHERGIDSVKLTKKYDNYYYLDFMETGSYELFHTNNG